MKRRLDRWWDFPAIFLFFVSIWISAIRLHDTGWTQDLYKVEFAVVLGCLVGILIGYSYFRPFFAFIAGILYTLVIFAWQFDVIIGVDPSWQEKYVKLAVRLWITYSQFIHNRPVYDPLLFLIIMFFFYWGISLFGGYKLVRSGKPVISLALAGIVLMIYDYYPPYLKYGDWYTGLFALLVLLIMGRIYYLKSQKHWKEKGALIESEAGFDINKGIITSALVLVMVAWITPDFINVFIAGSTSQEKLLTIWEPVRDRLSNLIVSLQSPPITTTSDYFGNTLLLGTSALQGEDVVFKVKVKEKPAGSRFFWRSKSFDYYQDGLWKNTIPENGQEILPPNSQLALPNWQDRQLVDLTFYFQTPSTRSIYLPYYPIVVDHRVWVYGEKIDNTGINDVISLVADPTIIKGMNYRARSWIAVPTADDLRKSTGDYPDWVKNKYLKISSDFPLRDINLAKQITKNQITPYDKTAAITRYLREHLQYSEKISAPSPNQDPLDWFLFDFKKGYCNYFAATEVLLLRSVGVPARMTVGFSEGKWDSKAGEYIVKIKDIHAWPEVYFNDFGWIEFEPTVSQPITSFLIEKDQTQEEKNKLKQLMPTAIPEKRDLSENEPRPLNNTGLNSYRNVIMDAIAICLILSIFIALWINYRKRSIKYQVTLFSTLENQLTKRGIKVPDWLLYLSWHSMLSPIEKLFIDTKWMLRFLGKKAGESQTPRERTELIIGILPQATTEAYLLLHEYEKEVYSQYPGDFTIAQKANLHLWIMVINTWFNKMFRI
jgi:transglutaminase-like putative cysteine protease